jgi:hypothetical protein
MSDWAGQLAAAAGPSLAGGGIGGAVGEMYANQGAQKLEEAKEKYKSWVSRPHLAVAHAPPARRGGRAADVGRALRSCTSTSARSRCNTTSPCVMIKCTMRTFTPPCPPALRSPLARSFNGRVLALATQVSNKYVRDKLLLVLAAPALHYGTSGKFKVRETSPPNDPAPAALPFNSPLPLLLAPPHPAKWSPP